MNIGIIIDLVTIILFILSIWEGYKKGLTKSLLKIFTFVIAIIVSFILFKPIANLVIDYTKIDENIQDTIIKVFEEETMETVNRDDNTNKNTNIFYSYVEDKIRQVDDNAKHYVLETTSREIAIAVINIMVFIILFIVLRIILMFIKALTDVITKLPVIKQCNKLGGGIYGAVRAVVIILAVFTVISLVAPLVSQPETLKIINESIVAKIIYENNIILKIIL